jgi:hypothetical protein
VAKKLDLFYGTHSCITGIERTATASTPSQFNPGNVCNSWVFNIKFYSIFLPKEKKIATNWNQLTCFDEKSCRNGTVDEHTLH